MRKAAIVSRGILVAVGSGVLFHVLLTAVLGAILSTILSGLTFLDPLYAGDRLESIWSNLATIMLLHGIHSLVTAPLVGASITYLHLHYPARSFYFLAPLLSLFLYFISAFIYRALWPLLSSDEISANTWLLSLISTGLCSPIIGLVTAMGVRRWDTANS